MLNADFFSTALSDNTAGLPIEVDRAIRNDAGDNAVVACEGLDLDQFVGLGHCRAVVAPSPRPDATRYWGGEDHDRLYSSYNQVLWAVEWNDHRLHVLRLHWDTGCGQQSRDWVIAESEEVADAFLLDVERKTHHPGEAILVFSHGQWRRSFEHYQAVQSASFDDLVLGADLKDSIRQDFRRFLESEEVYKRLGIAWRRGALMIGPPGNGKTHCVRALVKELDVPCLYVQSLEHRFLEPEQVWTMVFDRARGLRPCVLILEDLDSLLTKKNRSFFLNQLDGFEKNHGLIVLATTNYPERIDSAIIDRPSRFDRKYHFALPAHADRLAYLRGWQARLEGETGWNAAEVDGAADATDGFSFAYLKELVVSSLMQWLQNQRGAFGSVVTGQAAALRDQMATEAAPAQPDHRGDE